MTETVDRHPELAAGRWGQFSLAEQLANVGSEVGRMARWRDRLREITRARELLCAAALCEPVYGTTLEDLDRHFLAFAVAARNSR